MPVSETTDSDLSLRVEKLEKIVTELEFTNANIIKDYEELITICHALKMKYVDLKNAVEGTRISRIIT